MRNDTNAQHPLPHTETGQPVTMDTTCNMDGNGNFDVIDLDLSMLTLLYHVLTNFVGFDQECDSEYA